MTDEQQMLADKVRRYESALKLIWHVHVRAHQHLGLERFSGIEGRCIPCICALALQRTGDEAWPEMFDSELSKIENEAHSRG
jgi:hypothetical protein